MAEDNEFQSRQERNERIKNIEYQEEQEKEAVEARKSKERTRRERARRAEAKKEQERTAAAEKQKEAAASANVKRRQEQQEAKNIMEKNRQAKKPRDPNSQKGRANDIRNNLDVNRIDTNDQVLASSVASSASNLAKENVSTELYQDGKQVSERDLPQDLVKRIRNEQEKAIKQTENEIKDSKADSEENSGSSASNLEKYSATNSAINNTHNGSNAYDNSIDANLSRTSGFGVDVKNSTPKEVMSGNYNSSNESQSKSSANATEQNTTTSNSDNARNTAPNDTEGVMAPDTPDLNNREVLRANLAGLNNANNSGNQVNNSNGASSNNNSNNDDSISNNAALLGAGAGMAANGANNAIRRGTSFSRASSSQGAPAAEGDDIDSQLSSRLASGARRTSRIAGRAGRKISGAAKTLRTAMKARKFFAIGSLLAAGGVIVLIIILLVGAISFVMNMPGMVRDKIADAWDTLWQGAKGLVDDLLVEDKNNLGSEVEKYQIRNLATYLESMGYDLVDNGFVTKLEKDNNGNIKDIESKYLAAYIAAEERSYLLANENTNVIEMWQRVADELLGSTVSNNESWGKGMIVLEQTALESILDGLLPKGLITSLQELTQSFADFFTGKSDTVQSGGKNIDTITNRVIIKRDTKEMFISKVDIIEAYNRGGYDVYRYSLKEWTEKYGTPTELFLTLHLATRAPEFAYKWAITYDTKVFLEIMELQDVDVTLTYAQVDENGKIMLDKNNRPMMIPVSDMTDDYIKSKGISQAALEEMKKINNSKITAFTPYITKVLNHWYYQQVIFKGEYEGKKIDVYELRSLDEDDPGYVRYYAYTRRDNADSEKIKEDTSDLEPVDDSGLMGLLNVALKVMQTAFTGGFSGISGLMQSASEAALNEAFDMLGDAVVDEISSQIKDLLPDELAGMLNVDEFLKGNLSFESLQKLAEEGINLDNMAEFLDFDKITDSLNLENLQLDVEKLWDELNIQEELMNMDIAGLGSINDLEKVVDNIDLDNLNKVFDEQFDKFADFTSTSFDNLTEKLVGGFSSSIESLQNSIVDSCDQLFSGLSEADFGMISENLLNDVTKKISDLSVEPIINNLNSSIEKMVAGQFNTEILSGLQNEFSKQLTGLSVTDLSKLASIPDMDFDKLKNLSGQVTGITSALNGAESSINNLSNQVNKLSKDITGMDTKVLNSVAGSITELDNKVESLTKEAQATKNALSSLNSSNTSAKQLLSKVEELENKTTQLKNAGDKLNLNEITKLQNEINTCKSDINSIANTIEGLDDNTIGRIKTQITSLENKATGVIDHITSLDENNLLNLTNRLANLDKTGLVKLATDFSNLDVSSNQMKTLVTKYASDITDLRTSDINMIINGINGQNISTQQAINGISSYLMRSDETELANNLKTLNNSVKLVSDLTEDFDVNTVANLVEKVPGFDSLHLNNIANQVKNLQNVTIDKLLNQVEELPKKLVQNVSNQLTEKLKQGVKDGISQNLSQKLKGNLTGSGNFNERLKAGMTGGDGQIIDVETEDHDIEKPYSEYSTGFYVREIRTQDYFQIAEPVRVLYPTEHWKKIFMEDKYAIMDTPGFDMSKITDSKYIEENGKTIWQATDGNIDTAIYAMLQGVQSADSQYLFRYFKELFNDVSYIFSQESKEEKTDTATIGWIFKTAKIKEPRFVGNEKIAGTYSTKIKGEEVKNIHKIAMDNMPDGASYYVEEHDAPVEIYTLPSAPVDNRITEDDYAREHMPENALSYKVIPGTDISEDVDVNYRILTVEYYGYKEGQEVNLKINYYKYEDVELQEVEKAEFEPYIWGASKVGILNSKDLDPVYGFDEGLEIVAPANGVIVSKTEAKKNELGQETAQSVTIELRDTGDEKIDGMRIILIGGDYSSVSVGQTVKKETYTVDDDGNYSKGTAGSVIGKTTKEAIKVMVLDQDQTPVEDVSKYIYPPFQQYTPLVDKEEGNNNATKK